jgi:hypothetical protein
MTEADGLCSISRGTGSRSFVYLLGSSMNLVYSALLFRK